MGELVVVVVDRQLALSLAASARSRPGCQTPRMESEWRQELKETVDFNHGAQG